jgi:hypothetical protein
VTAREGGERGAGGPANLVGRGGKKRREGREMGREEKNRERRELAGLDRFSFLFFQNLLNHTFKPFLNQFFTQLFTIILKTFHKYFKTFKTTPQPKLMLFNTMHKQLIDSNYLNIV